MTILTKECYENIACKLLFGFYPVKNNNMKEIYTDLEKPLMDFNNPKPLMKDMFYYTPDLSDLRIGYECEANITIFKIKEEWKPCTLKGVGPEVVEYHKQGIYRTPYLTKQDIENEMWIPHAIIKNIWFKENISEKGILYLKKEESYITIEDDRDSEFLFKGLCPSINELRTIQKLIGIK